MVTGGADSDLRRADVVVVGGGPAGLASAIAIRLKGFEVTVLDPACPPIDKACGEGIPPAGVEVLRQLGVRLAGHDAFALRGNSFSGRWICGRGNLPHSDAGLALRRIGCTKYSTGRAAELGVRPAMGHAPSLIVCATSFQWLVGADGKHSCVRHAARIGCCDGVRRMPLWLSPALPDFAVDRFRRSILGHTLPDLRNAGEPG